MSIPKSYISPQSQPWARWVTDNIRNILNKNQKFDIDTYNAIRQLNIAQRQPMRAVLWNQVGGTVVVTTAGDYYPINIAGTLDPDATFNMTASSAPNVTGLKNNTDQARTVVIIATYDGKAGNNHAVGLKLALNGVAIDATECRSFGGSTGQVGKTMTQWIERMEPGDEVTMLGANIDATDDLVLERFKLLAHAVS
jgi:hypothetical protein